MSRTLFEGTTRKVLLSLGALGVAGALAGMGTFATFTATTSASQTLSSGTVVIALGATGAATNRLTLSATGLVPGDTVQRSFDLSNTGSQGLASVTLSTVASPSSLLDTDATQGVQMVVSRCSLAWTESASAPYTYTCGGALTTILASQAVIQSNVSMGALSALTAGSTDHLRVTLTFPSTASLATFQGITSTISYTFTGTQRPGTSQ
jgi:predicted ribosomally synthesized peptide with SipW-like signal peptide